VKVFNDFVKKPDFLQQNRKNDDYSKNKRKEARKLIKVGLF
jgi:hypothetical protein